MKLSTQLKERLRVTQPHTGEPSETVHQTHVKHVTVQIDAEKIAAMELDRECILERSRLVSSAPARMPYIGFYGKYNKRWYVDIVALPHNSIRTFISEVFGLLTAVSRLSLDMTDKDFEKVFFFLREFTLYARVILESEEKVLYPEVDGALKKKANYSDSILHPKNRAERRQCIIQLLTVLTNREVMEMPSVTIAKSLQETVDEISLQMFDYFSTKESELPKLLAKAFRGPKEKNKMESKLIKYFADSKKQYQYTAFLALPLHTEEVRADFEDRHFSKNERAHFARAVRNMRETVMAIPKAFDDAARNYESRFSMAAFLENYDVGSDAEMAMQVV